MPTGCQEVYFFFQAEDGIRDLVRSRGLGDVYKRQVHLLPPVNGRSLTPDYRLLDEQEGAVLRQRVLELSLIHI